MTIELPDQAVLWLKSIIGPFRTGDRPALRGTRNAVIHLATPEGEFYFKIHRETQHWHREVYAYSRWCPALSPFFPELIGVFSTEHHSGILTRAVPGLPLEKIRLAGERLDNAWYEAGKLAGLVISRFQNDWFGIPDRFGAGLSCWGSDPVEYARLELASLRCSAEALRLIDDRKRKLIEWALDHCTCFAGEKPHAVIRDFAPGNWLVDNTGKFLSAVDLEDIAWGLKAENFAHLWTLFRSDREREMAAFFKGFGEPYWTQHPDQARSVCIKQALSACIYGAVHASRKHSDRAEKIFSWLASMSA